MKRADLKRSDSPRNSRGRRASTEPVSINNRSRITNGALGIDIRTQVGRRWRDIYAETMRRTKGRNEALSRALASLTIQREAMDAAMASGEVVDVALLVKLTSEIRRVQERLGLIDEPEPPAPTLLPHDAPAWLLGPRAPAPSTEAAE